VGKAGYAYGVESMVGRVSEGTGRRRVREEDERDVVHPDLDV